MGSYFFIFKIKLYNVLNELPYKREIMIFLNMFLHFKSKHAIKGEIAQLRRNKVNLHVNQILWKIPTYKNIN